MSEYDRWLDALEAKGCKPKGPTGKVKALCPVHGDRNPSLSLTEGDNGNALVHCFTGCTFEDIRAALGLEGPPALPMGRTEPPREARTPTAPPKPSPLPSGQTDTLYRYYDADGGISFIAVRHQPPGRKKRFSQWTPYDVDNGLWLPEGLKVDRPLYRLPQLPTDGRIAVVEGEKVRGSLPSRMAWTSRHDVGRRNIRMAANGLDTTSGP